MLTERTQVLLSRDQLARLRRIAGREGRSLGSVIRDAVDAYTIAPADDRGAAIDRLCALDAPVADWETMKAEILHGVIGAQETRGARRPGHQRPRGMSQG